MTTEERKKQCEMLAYWWIHSASTGHAKTRKIFHGTNGPELTDQEKINDAMITAMTHIHNYTDACESED